MANRTDGMARVYGSKENLLKFVDILEGEEGVPYLPRTSVNWVEMTKEEIMDNEEDEFSFAFDVDCAWSMVDCWLNYGLDEANPLMQHITSITKDLDLEVKAVSYEPGAYFVEYLHVDKGVVCEERFWDEADAKKIKVKCPKEDKDFEQLYVLYENVVDEFLDL